MLIVSMFAIATARAVMTTIRIVTKASSYVYVEHTSYSSLESGTPNPDL